jgi:uncharacterized damage-inducible protein DinB
MPDRLARLFAYDADVNRQLLEALRAQPEAAAGDPRRLFAHLVAAEDVWIHRLRGEDAGAVPIWPDDDWDACAARLDAVATAYAVFLAAAPDLDAPAHYTNSAGTPFATPVGDILHHVLIHSGYHRGQVARALRAAGGTPVNTDLITYVRAASSAPD